MTIIKNNLLLFTFGILSFISITIFLGYRSNIASEIEETEDQIRKVVRLQEGYHEEISVFKNLKNDFSKVQDELSQLATIEKNQNLFWKKILNHRENHMVKWKNKTAESVNADITRMFSSLRARCRAKDIELPSAVNKAPTIGFGSTNKKPENNYGFGFSAYDGFWPSFSQEEAKIIGVQAKIIKEIVEILTQSVTDKKKLKLIKILRESAGSVDIKHIKNDQLNLGSERHLLLQSMGKIESLVFEISIKGQSSHARRFINQLRAPYMLRDISVKREIVLEEKIQEDLNFIPNPFGNTSDKISLPKNKISPIVKDVNSEFIFLIEYITEISNDFSILFNNKLIWENAEKDLLVEFLTKSGNAEIIEEAKSKLFSTE